LAVPAPPLLFLSPLLIRLLTRFKFSARLPLGVPASLSPMYFLPPSIPPQTELPRFFFPFSFLFFSPPFFVVAPHTPAPNSVCYFRPPLLTFPRRPTRPRTFLLFSPFSSARVIINGLCLTIDTNSFILSPDLSLSLSFFRTLSPSSPITTHSYKRIPFLSVSFLNRLPRCTLDYESAYRDLPLVHVTLGYLRSCILPPRRSYSTSYLLTNGPPCVTFREPLFLHRPQPLNYNSSLPRPFSSFSREMLCVPEFASFPFVPVSLSPIDHGLPFSRPRQVVFPNPLSNPYPKYIDRYLSPLPSSFFSPCTCSALTPLVVRSISLTLSRNFPVIGFLLRIPIFQATSRFER